MKQPAQTNRTRRSSRSLPPPTDWRTIDADELAKRRLRAVTVVNLIAEGTIEHGMLASLAQKMEQAQGVLDGVGDLTQIKLKGGKQAFLKRLEQVMATTPSAATATPKPIPSDPAADFAARARQQLGERFEHCEETWVPGASDPVIIAVVRDLAERERVEPLFAKTAWRGDRPVLQVLDIATRQALDTLAATGMISSHTRATRALLSGAI